MSARHPNLDVFDRAVAEHDVAQLADEIGYTMTTLDDGVLVLTPPVTPAAEPVSAPKPFDHCADCGDALDALNRHQVPVYDTATGHTTLTYVCRRHYVARRHMGPR